MKTYYRLILECKSPEYSDMSEAQREKLQEINLRFLGRHINENFPLQFTMTMKKNNEEF